MENEALLSQMASCVTMVTKLQQVIKNHPFLRHCHC